MVSLGPLVHVEGTLNRFGYESILADHIHLYMLIVFLGADGIFQQDYVTRLEMSTIGCKGYLNPLIP